MGLADPIVDEDVDASERLDDGLPQSLAASVRRYGLRELKIKISGDIERDAERLNEILVMAAAKKKSFITKFSFDRDLLQTNLYLQVIRIPGPCGRESQNRSLFPRSKRRTCSR